MATADYGPLTDIELIKRLAGRLLDAERDVAIDLETGYASSEPDREGGALDWDWDKQFVVGISISGDPSWARYIPLRHDSGGNAEEDKVWPALKDLLTCGKITAHHAKFEERGILKAAGYKLATEEGSYLEDTMLMAYAMGGIFGKENAIRASYGLKDLVEILAKHRMTRIEELFPIKLTEKQLNAMRFNVLDVNSKVVTYACEDAAWSLWLRRKYRDRAQEERPLMFRLEHEISRIMAEVEAHGVAVDWDSMRDFYALGQQFIPLMETTIQQSLGKLAGREISSKSLNSPKQMRELLYRDMGLTTSRMTPSAEKKLQENPNTPKWELMSTDGDAMKGLAKKHPAIKLLLEYREALNMSNRQRKWLYEVEPYSRDGRAHANYRQAGVEQTTDADSNKKAPGTGRFSASDPAIQQCPKEWRWAKKLGADVWDDDEWAQIVTEGENGKDYWHGQFREFIVAAPDHYLLTFDFSQIELRVIAGVSQEPALLEAFECGLDVHQATAAQMLGKRVEDVSKKERQDYGKRLNFALLYQEGPAALAEQLTVSVEKAKEMMAQYFAAFSRISSWQEHATARGLRLGYAETKFGRRYEVWELKSKNKGVQAKGKRVLVNAPIQGGAADYMKISMLRVARELKRLGWWGSKVMMVMNQHDALTFECHNSMDPNEVRAVLNDLVTWKVRDFPKIVADWELGQTWGGADPWKDGMVARWNGQKWELVYPQDEETLVETVDEPVDEIPEPCTVSDSSTQVLSLAASVSAQSGSASGTVVIKAHHNPDRESFGRLLNLIASMPGGTEVVLRCPAGEVPLGVSSLSMGDSGRVSLILGGAMMTATAGSDEIRKMASGLSL